MASARMVSLRAWSYCGISRALFRQKLHPNSSSVFYNYSSAGHPQVLQRNDAVKPFSEMPGEGSVSFAQRVTYALKGWQTRSREIKPWERYGEKEKKYGSIYKRVFGNTALVYISDPKDIEHVCRNEGKYPKRFGERYNLNHAWQLYKSRRDVPFGLLTSNDQSWFRSRTNFNKKMMRPVELPKYADVVNDVITDLNKEIRRVRQDDNIIPDFQLLMYSWSLESITGILFNKRLNLLGESPPEEALQFIRGILDVFETSVVLFKFPANVQAALKTQPWRKHVKAWDVIFNYGVKSINEKVAKLKSLEEKGELPTTEELDIIDHLLLHGDLSIEEIYSNMSEILLGAIDTTANALQWAVYYLARNQEKQEILYNEVRKVVPDGEAVSYKYIKNAPYVMAVIKETLRLRPVVVNNSRILDNDITIQGYNIPAGTPIIMMYYQMGRNPAYFSDPLEFKPERWLRDGGDDVNPFTTLPFGFGPRMCIGRRIALLEIQLLLSRFSQDFVVESTENVEAKMTFLALPDRPLKPKFRDR